MYKVGPSAFNVGDYEVVVRFLAEKLQQDLQLLDKLFSVGGLKSQPHFVDEIKHRIISERASACRSTQMLLSLHDECKRAHMVEFFSRGPANKALSHLSPAMNLQWFHSDAYKELRIPSIEQLCKAASRAPDTAQNLDAVAHNLELFEALYAYGHSREGVCSSFRDFLRNVTPRVKTCRGLQKVYFLLCKCVQIIDGHSTVLDTFGSAASNTVLTFDATEAYAWLQGDAYQRLRVPTAGQLCDSISRTPAKAFNDGVRLLDHLHKNDPEVAASSCKAYVVRHLKRHDADRCLDVIAAWKYPIVQHLGDADGNIFDELSSAMRTCLSGSWTVAMNEFAAGMSNLLNHNNQMSKSLSAVIENTVVALLRGVAMSDPASPRSLMKTYREARSESSRLFWSHFVIRLAKSTFKLTKLDSIQTLLDTMDKWSVPHHPDESIFGVWLVMAKSELDRLLPELTSPEPPPLKGDCNSVLTDIRARFETLLSKSNIQQASFLNLQRCSEHQMKLSFIETALLSRQTLLSPSSVAACTGIWTDSYARIKKERGFLASLHSYLPIPLGELEVETKYNAPDDEAKCESSEIMQTRKEQIIQWLRPFVEDGMRELWCHFMIGSSSRSSSTDSAIFRHFLETQRQELTDNTWMSAGAFSDSIAHVRTLLSKLLRLQQPTLSFGELMNLANALKSESRLPKHELEILTDFPTFLPARNTNVCEDLEIVLQLHGLREPLSRLPETLKRFDFKCSHAETADPDFDSICELATSLSNAEETQTWNVDICKSKLTHIAHLTCGSRQEDASADDEFKVKDKYNIIIGLLGLFEELRKAEKVWEFVHSRQKEFVSSSGDGYSKLFYDKVEDFLSQLGGEDNKVLENFARACSWVGILVFNQKCSFQTLMQNIHTSPKIMAQAQLLAEQQPFSQLGTAESHMDFINNLFQKGLGGLDSVLQTFEQIKRNCIYIFDLQRGELRLTYTGIQNHAHELSNEEILDFEQRLSFVQHEEKAQAYDVGTYLKNLNNYHRHVS